MDAFLNGLDAVSPHWARRSYPTGIGGAQAGGQGRMGLGFGSPYASMEPGGDAGEGIDVPAVALGTASGGRGDSYTPLPGVLPTKDHLDYVQKLSTAGLLTLGFLALIFIGVVNPGRAIGLLGRGAKRQAGIS